MIHVKSNENIEESDSHQDPCQDAAIAFVLPVIQGHRLGRDLLGSLGLSIPALYKLFL